jgi:hypothetical protein
MIVKKHGEAAHYNNLISFNEMTPEQHREISSKGGKASADKRRKKAEAIKVFEMSLLMIAVKENLIDDIDEFIRWRANKKKRGRKCDKDNYDWNDMW